MGKLMKGMKPNLTERQKKLLSDLMKKKASGKITDFQLVDLGDLIKQRDQKPKLSKGAETYLDSIIQEIVFGRSKKILSKYLDKGNAVEEKSISLYCNVTGNLFFKNDKRFRNEWITGEPDNIDGKVRDIKSSWDFSTFPLHAQEIPTIDYEWQLITYMELTGLKEAELIYCLVDTPEHLVTNELWNVSRKLGLTTPDSIPIKLKVETVSNLIYTEVGLMEYCASTPDPELTFDMFKDFEEIVPEHRVKSFHLDYDYSRVKQMYTQAELAREYLIENTIKIANKLKAA